MADVKTLKVLEAAREKRRQDKNLLHDNEVGGKLPPLNEIQRIEVQEMIGDQTQKMRTHELSAGVVEGALLGFLGGAILGGPNLAISGAFTWAVIRTIMVGLT